MSEKRFDRIDQALNAVKAQLGDHDERFASMEETLAGHSERFDRIDQRIGVLHEDVLSRIAAIPAYSGPTRGEWLEGLADLKETITRRLDPLEAIVRQHSTDIAELKRTVK